jgi:AraC-like DNA-binding protein
MLEAAGEATFSAVLGAHALNVKVSDSRSYCGRWEDTDPQVDHGVFHLIDDGNCWVRAPSVPAPVQLQSGDLVMFPHGSEHTLCSEPGVSEPLAEDSHALVLCCEFSFAAGRRNPLLDALPNFIVVREADGGERFRKLAQLMSTEARADVFGSQVVLDKLSDALFTMALRHYVQHAERPQGLIAALADSRLSRALAAIHSDPGKDWTVAMLAGVALQSRTAFAQRFVEVMGASPYQYLTEWRMAEAERLLRDPSQSAATVAEKLGYQTEAAFRRAFKKIHGYGPGRVRRDARAIGTQALTGINAAA